MHSYNDPTDPFERVNPLSAELKAALEECDRLCRVVEEVHAWAVCRPITSDADLLQNIDRIIQITRPKEGEQVKHSTDLTPEEFIASLIEDEQQLCAGLNRVLAEAGVEVTDTYEAAFRQIVQENKRLRATPGWAPQKGEA